MVGDLVGYLNSVYLLCEIAAVCMADKKSGHQSRVMQCHIEPPLCSAADTAVSD